MTGDWLTLSEAARRISKATGRNTSMEDVLRLGEAARLIVTFEHGYHHVYTQSVVAYLSLLPASELAAHGGDDQTAGPTVGGGPELPAEIEDEYQRGKDT